MKALLKRAYDACVTDASVTIFINKVNLHQEIPQLRRTHRKKDDNGDVKKAYQDFPDPERIQLGDHRNFMGHTRTGVVRQRVSTILGGKHVDYVLNQITKKASDLINKRGPTSNHSTSRTNCSYTQEYDPEPRLQRPDGDSGHAGDEVPEEDRSFGQVRGTLVKNTDISKLASLWRRPPNRKL
jgi:hypothetical protein